jgi:hypothetical protein
MTSDDAIVRQYVAVEEADLEEARAAAREHGVELDRAQLKTIEPISGIMLVLVGSALAVAAVLRVIEQRKGGQIIDMRPGASKLAYRSRDVLYGLVIIIVLDGTVSVEVKEPTSLFAEIVAALISALTEAGSTDSASVQSIATQVAAGRAEIALQPS